ncbi:PAS domain S-box protein [Thiolapillus sp.]
MNLWTASMLLLLGILMPVSDAHAATSQDSPPTPATELTLGVFSYFPPAEIHSHWQPLVDYLNSRLENARIKLRVMNLHDIDDALASKDLDFIITNPGHYILLRERYNLEGALATIIRQAGEGQSTQQTGGVIFARQDRADISRLASLRGKWIAVAGTKHLGGYQAQAYELLQAGILLPRDAYLIETGDYNTVIETVLSGNVDAGFIPAGVLEDAHLSGEHSLKTIKVINENKQPGFPYLISTRLYPQWPVFALPHVQQEFTNAFLETLAALKPNHPAAQAAHLAGFAPPADYQSAESIIQALKLPPYDISPAITLRDIWEQHKLAGSILLLATLVILILLHLLITRNRQLQTQRLLAEDSASHFEQIICATQAGTWKWNIKTGNAVFNNRWAEIIGYTLVELSPVSIDTWVQLTHPADSQGAQKLLQQHFRGETEYFECSFRMRHKDGHWVWVQSRGKVTNWEADGTPLWMFGTHMDITERKESSLALQASQAKYQQLVDNIGEKFIIYSHRGLTGELTYVSDGVTSIFGLTKEEMLGKSWFEVVDWLPQDVEKARIHIQQRMAEKATFMQLEMRFVHPSGNQHILRISSHPVWDAKGNIVSIDGIAEDITEQMRSQERARMAATVFAHSQESIIVTDTDARIIDCNPASGRLTGYSREELIGRNPRLLASGTHTAGFYQHLWQTLTSGRVWQGAFRNLRKNGTPYWIEASISPIKDQDGNITQYVAVSRDITRRKQQLGALRQAKREAQAANTAKSEFVANISHEIRTPMNAILGFTDLCLEGDLAPQQRKYLGNVKESAHTMLSLINEILDFSKIEAGKLVIESIPFDLDRELTMVASMTRQLVHTKEVELQLVQDTRGPNILLGDPLRLKQILTNLTSNAVKFTNQGKIQITARELQRNDDSIEIEFSVCDSGIGMSQDKLNSIFQPFSQADSSTTRKFGGTGLGLTISSQLIEKMGGKIEVESEPGIGSTFYFCLSFPLPGEGEFPDQPEDSLQQPFKQLQNTRVLLVEDNQINRELATEVLERHQLLVDTASDGQKALEKLEQQQYDLVLMDIQMPIMDGYEATWIIRNQLKLKKLPVIALTASTSTIVREKCMRAGMDDYVSKPIDIHELMEKIDKVINPVLQKMAANQTLTPFSSPQEPGTFSSAPGIDAIRAMRRLTLDEAGYTRLLKKFAANHRQDIAQLQGLILEQKWEDASRLAHTLKGLSNTIGATELPHMAADLEQQLKVLSTTSGSANANAANAAPGNLNALLEQAGKALEEITRHIDELQDHTTPAAPSQAAPGQIQDLGEKLNTLLELTQQYSVTALAEINALLALVTEEATLSELQNIQHDLENFDFDAAAASLKTLLVQI